MRAVLDTSVVVAAMASNSIDAQQARQWIDEICDGDDAHILRNLTPLEMLSALRRLVNEGEMDPRWAEAVHRRMFGWPFVREDLTQHHIERTWELRGNFTPYDGAYLALTESLESRHRERVVVLTANGTLARAPNLPCEVVLFPKPPV